jgi:hypothetical protein
MRLHAPASEVMIQDDRNDVLNQNVISIQSTSRRTLGRSPFFEACRKSFLVLPTSVDRFDNFFYKLAEVKV